MSRTRVELGLRADLGGDCANCVGLCCVGLAFARSADFAYDKAAGDPCRNLDEHDRCSIHSVLRPSGFRGCTVFDCFGAGQKVTQQTFAGRSWRDGDDVREQMFAVFPIVRRLHELLWYLDQALALRTSPELHGQLSDQFERVLLVSDGTPAGLSETDVDREFDLARPLLIEASRAVRSGVPASRSTSRRRVLAGADLTGADLTYADLRGADLRGAVLIAADLRGADLALCDLLGADLRDADVREANLDQVIYLTQMQLNAMRGDAATTLPAGLGRPTHWEFRRE